MRLKDGGFSMAASEAGGAEAYAEFPSRRSEARRLPTMRKIAHGYDVVAGARAGFSSGGRRRQWHRNVPDGPAE